MVGVLKAGKRGSKKSEERRKGWDDMKMGSPWLCTPFIFSI